MKIESNHASAYLSSKLPKNAERPVGSEQKTPEDSGIEEPGAGSGDGLPNGKMIDLPMPSRGDKNTAHGVGGGGYLTNPATTSERERPTGPSWLRSGDSGGEKVGLDTFSRGKQLMDLVDPWQAMVGGRELTPGQASFEDLAGSVGTPNNGDGKNPISCQGPRSAGGDEPSPVRHDESTSAAPAATERSWTFGRVWSEITRALDKPSYATPTIAGVRGTPNPMSDASERSHMPKMFESPTGPRKSIREVEEARKHQVTQPGEDGNSYAKVSVDPAELYAGMMAKHIDGRSQPTNDDVVPHGGEIGGGDPYGRNGGNPRPADPADAIGLGTPSTDTTNGKHPGEPPED